MAPARSTPSPTAFPGPHRFPFRWIDRSADEPDGPPVALLSAGASLPGTSVPSQPLTLLVEMMAQGALVALAGAVEQGGSGTEPPPPNALSGAAVRLAGIDGARYLAAVGPGDRLTVETRVEGRFGALSKVRCRLERDGETVAEAGLLLATG